MKNEVFEMLVNQVKESFNYDDKTAREYAKYLVETGMQIYEEDLKKENK